MEDARAYGNGRPASVALRLERATAGPVPNGGSMSGRVQSYETDEIVVTFDPGRCTHSAMCIRGLPGVFDVSRKRWIDLKQADADAVMGQIDACPSGALQYIRKA